MRTKFSVLILAMATAVSAEDRFDIKLKEKGGPNILRESAQLQLTSEPGVQREPRRTSRGYSLGWSRLQAGLVQVQTPHRTMKYDLGAPKEFLAFSYTALPVSWYGQWGVQGGVAYGFHEITGVTKTMLHIFPLTLDLVYRGRQMKTNLWAPQVNLGVGDIVYVQRGTSETDTSESKWVGRAGLGLWWGVGEWLAPDSPVPLELTFNYTRQFAQSTRLNDWNGSMFSMNVGIGLE